MIIDFRQTSANFNRMCTKMAKFLILNGPNLNMLGKREPDIYGADTLDNIMKKVVDQAKANGYSATCEQRNAEHELIELIQDAMQNDIDFIIFNPGAYTHTSIALRDALLSVKIPFIEVHLSNVYAREKFRQHSYLSDIAVGVITGLGAQGYELALQAAIKHTESC